MVKLSWLDSSLKQTSLRQLFDQIEDIGTFSKILHKRTISNEIGIVIAKVPDPEKTPETVIEKQLNLVNEGFA